MYLNQPTFQLRRQIIEIRNLKYQFGLHPVKMTLFISIEIWVTYRETIEKQEDHNQVQRHRSVLLPG